MIKNSDRPNPFNHPEYYEADKLRDLLHDKNDEIVRLTGELTAAQSKLDRVSKLLDDWANAEKQGLGVPILAGIGQIREAMK